jgi:hypothetical protein
MQSLSSFSTVSLKITTNSYEKNLDNYIIDNVSYVGQDGPYCAYATITMVFNYYGANTTLREILFNSGVGYSFGYNKIKVIDDITLSRQVADRKFLADIYGLHYERWLADTKNLTHNECWEQYWNIVKENISNDIPPIAVVNPFLLPTLKEYLENPKWMQYFNLTLPSSHAIVLVGYNESSGEICYNDPATELFGNPDKGKYAWMNISSFKNAVKTATGAKYFIEVFKNESTCTLNKSEIFLLAHHRNIERMKGNHTAYDTKFESLSLGIEGLKLLKKDLEIGITKRLSTILNYKLRAFSYRIFSRVIKFDQLWWTIFMGIYDYFPILKNHAYLYLSNNSQLFGFLEEEAILFRGEAENWTQLNKSFSEFKSVRLISYIKPRLIINKMVSFLDNIIKIEEEIIHINNKYESMILAGVGK